MSPNNELTYKGSAGLPLEDMNTSTRDLVMFEHEGNLIFEHETLGAERTTCFSNSHRLTEIAKCSSGTHIPFKFKANPKLANAIQR